MPHLTPLILIGAALNGLLYAVVLDPLYDRYVPDGLWIVVLVGVVFIAVWFVIWLATEPLPTLDRFAAFYRFFYICCAVGFPIIGWQVGQRRSRLLIRRANGTGGSYDQDARRPGRA